MRYRGRGTGRAARTLAVASVMVLLAGLAACAPAASVKQTCDPTDRDHWAIAYTKLKNSYVKGVYWLVGGKPRPINNDKVIQAQTPSLSPDGRRVYFEGFYGKGGKYSNKMVLADTDGTHLKVFGEGISTPVWSPDGTRVAYRDTDTDADTIVMADPDNGHRHRIATDAATDPAWSADGTKLAWTSTGGTTFHWKSVDGGGEGSVDVVSGDLLTQAWLPDGKSVAVSLVVGDDIDLYLVSLSGKGKPRFLAKNVGAPSTLPDGTIGALDVAHPDADVSDYVSVDPKTGKRENVAKIQGDDVSVIACYP
ncbi:MAG TPA: hypothetical protein VE172_19005 [Stackebrandtia sp.]|uniref:TolB family protein n=1 Tax=Stackebrandtia sp. TaxID=2023065 RepID=UPI002D40B17C|nr:hypothetical protein [Stackebrandtia sp.]HZE40892.1 hypothetical protein [Stackebrandtia sp.]